jgi:hypothetical protein
VSEQRAKTIGNEAAHELVAEGTDIATGRLVTLFQNRAGGLARIRSHAGHGLDARDHYGAGVPDSGANVPQDGAIT